jgi:hypothetical protein
MFYSVPTNPNCLCVYSESVPRSRATVTNMYNLMHMWHHVTNHLIIFNDKDSNSENRMKLRVRDNPGRRGLGTRVLVFWTCTEGQRNKSSLRIHAT